MKLITALLALFASAAFAVTPDPGPVEINDNYMIQDRLDSDTAYIGRVFQNRQGGGFGMRDVFAISECRALNPQTGEEFQVSWRYVRYHGLTGLAEPCLNPYVEVRDRTQNGCCVVSAESGGADVFNMFQGIWWKWNHELPQTASPPIK